MNNEDVNNNITNGNVASNPAFDDIEILDMDDITPTVTPSTPIENKEVENVKPMTSIPPIEEVLGENIVVPQPKVETTTSGTGNPLPAIEDVLGTSEPTKVEPAVVEPKVEENKLPSLDEMFGPDVTAPTPEPVVNKPVVEPAPAAPSVEEPTKSIPSVSDVFGVSTPKVETTATPVTEPTTPVVEPTVPVTEPTAMNAKEEEVVSKLENTDMTPTKEEKKEELENTILLNKQLNDAKMAIKAEEAKKDPEQKNKNGLMLVIALFTVLIVAVIVIPFIFNYLNS